MIIELKNETALVKFLDNYDTMGVRDKYPSLIIPEISESVDGDASNTKGNEKVIPLMLGELVQIGPGRELDNGSVIIPEGLSVGQTILFQINDQLSYENRHDNQTYYLIGLGNILAVIE